MTREILNASEWIRCARRSDTSGSVSLRRVSASNPNAPIGVFSSWLTFATKSRSYFFEAAAFGDVVDYGDDTERALSVVDALSAHRQRSARRAVQLERAFF